MTHTTPVHAPRELATARLRLRAPTSRDAEAVFAYASDAEVARFMSWPRHQALEDTRRFLALAEEEWRRSGVGTYLVLDARDQVIGSTGLHLTAPHRAITGYVLARPHWGQGLATELARAMLALAQTLALVRVEADCFVEHVASARVLEKAGFDFECLRRAYLVGPNLGPQPREVRSYARVFAAPA